METVINQTKLTVFYYLYNKDTVNTDFLNICDRALIVAMISGFVTICWAALLHYKLSKKCLKPLASRTARAAAVEPSPLNYFHHSLPTTLSPSFKDFCHCHKQLQEILPIDITLLLMLLFLVLSLFIYSVIKWCRNATCRTNLVLEIGNEEDSFSWNFLSLPYNADSYGFGVNEQQAQIKLHKLPFAGILEQDIGRSWRIGAPPPPLPPTVWRRHAGAIFVTTSKREFFIPLLFYLT